MIEFAASQFASRVISRWAWGAYVTVDLGKANGTPVVYTITFNSNDGTPVAPQNINAGEKLKEPTPAPTREGFTFDGWYEDSTFSKKFDFNTPITDSMTLYAKWTENKYTLTFDANGGTGSMTAIADLTGEYILPSNEFTAPSGKQFKGWSLTTDGAIVTKVDMTENRTVYAIWENIPVVTYTVSFAANGGTGTMTAATGISGNYTLPAPIVALPSVTVMLYSIALYVTTTVLFSFIVTFKVLPYTDVAVPFTVTVSIL